MASRAASNRYFDDVADVFLCPVNFTPAFPHDRESGGKWIPACAGMTCVSAFQVYLPAARTRSPSSGLGINSVCKLQVRNRLPAVDAWQVARPGNMRGTGKVAII